MRYYVLEFAETAFRVFTHYLRDLEPGNTIDDEIFKYSVVGDSFRHGIETAAVKSSITGADEREFLIQRGVLRRYAQFLRNAFDDIYHKRYDISGSAAYERDIAVFMYVAADAGVYADRADVDPIPPVAVDEVKRAHSSAGERAQIAKLLYVCLPERPDEIIAGSARIMRYSDIRALCRAVGALVERTVAAARINLQHIGVFRFSRDFHGSVHRRFR